MYGLALLYALWDKCYTITLTHLNAALAVWDYCHASMEYLFGDMLGDSTADAIQSALRGAADGMTRTAISGLFSRNISANKIATALNALKRRGLAHSRSINDDGRGRPAETWYARRANSDGLVRPIRRAKPLANLHASATNAACAIAPR